MKYCKLMLCFVFTLLFLPSLRALRPGDPVTEIAALKWIRGVPVSILPERNAKAVRSKVILFFQTTDFNTREAVQLFDQLRRTYGRRCRFAAVTPSPEQEARAFAGSLPDGFSVALDSRREITASYMEKSSFFPMAFLIDEKGVIRWNGEAVDLAEALERYFRGQLPEPKKQRELSQLLDELQLQLRENQEHRMKATVKKIFRLDPANAAALRIRLFVLQNSNRPAEAWELLLDRIDDAPEVKRLYFTAIDLAGTSNQNAAELDKVLTSYWQKITQDPEADTLLAWTLLQRRPEDGAALAWAAKLGGRAVRNTSPNAEFARRATLETTLALLDYRLGHLAEALRRQKLAVGYLESARLTATAQAARQREAFYRTALELAQSK